MKIKADGSLSEARCWYRILALLSLGPAGCQWRARESIRILCLGERMFEGKGNETTTKQQRSSVSFCTQQKHGLSFL